MTNQEISQLILDKCKLNTEIITYEFKNQSLEIENDHLKDEVLKLKKELEELKELGGF